MKSQQLQKEIDMIIEELKGYFSLDGLKKRFNLEDYTARDEFQIEMNHQYLSECDEYINSGKDISFPTLIDLDKIFTDLDKQFILSPVELYNILELLLSSEEIQIKVQELDDHYYHLKDDALDLNPVVGLRRDITNCISSDLKVADTASSTLSTIRGKIRELTKSLSQLMTRYKNKYSRYLASESVAFKGGMDTLAIKSSFKSDVKGTLIAYSATGETCYIVPDEVFQIKNKLSTLENEEKSEETKILADLSMKCFKQNKYLKRDYEILMNMDRFFSSARYGLSYMGTIAKSGDHLSLLSLFHPLLKEREVISNDVILGDKEPKTLLITGPNAGGKSVLIKAVALSVLMDKLGLYVPCKREAIIPYIDEVYFLGGDNQSVIDNLSTFSSHLMNIKDITNVADSSSLVIIDEVGEGTSPKDGEAIGVALLKYFVKLNCYSILTSHFDGVKIYASKDDSILTAAMEFDMDTIRPTYRLLTHTTGKSYGLLLAKQIGLKDEIIDDAKVYQDERENKDVDSLLEKLTEQASENDKKLLELEKKQKNLDNLIEKKKKALESLYDEKNQIKMKADAKIEKLVQARIEKIDAIWNDSDKKKDLNYSEISKAKGALKEAIKEETVIKEINVPLLKDIMIGDLLEDEEGRRSKVLEIKKDEVYLDMDGLKIRRKIKGLKRAKLTASDIKKEKEKSEFKFNAASIDSPSQGLELNIIGLHVDEAMRKAVSFINSAIVHHNSIIRIIHGAGTFALKNALWKYLANHKELVDDYRLGGQGEGGLGVTVIHLR